MTAHKKKPVKTSGKKKSNSAGAILDVEVLQHGVVQASGQWIVGGFRKKIVTFGASTHADMSVPFSTLPPKVDIFEVSPEGVNVKIDPRTEGFINRGHEFSDVRELLAPRGALAEIASIEDPLHVWLEPGSRGALRIYGYEILFKYKKKQTFKSKLKVHGEALVAFVPAHTDIAIERKAVWLAFFCVIAFSVPLTMWLLKAPVLEYTSPTLLPRNVLQNSIAPEHYTFLPRFFGEAFNYENAQAQAVFLVSEFKKRWDANDAGQSYSSPLELMRHPMYLGVAKDNLDDWRQKVAGKYRSLDAFKQDPYSPRYYQFQVDYPRISAGVSGSENGNIRYKIAKRIAQVRNTYNSVFSLIKVEYKYIRNFYDGVLSFSNMPNSEILIQPDAVFVGNKPNPEFEMELTRYLYAANLAYNAAKMSGGSDATKSVFLSKRGLLYPFQSAKVEVWSDTVEKNLVQNALYSLAEKPLPPVVPPKPKISKAKVEEVIQVKREELKACYDSLLRRNSEAQGIVNIAWVINQKGRAEEPRVVSSDIKDGDFQFCVRARLMNWQFPLPEHGVVKYEFPFKFKIQSR